MPAKALGVKTRRDRARLCWAARISERLRWWAWGEGAGEAVEGIGGRDCATAESCGDVSDSEWSEDCEEEEDEEIRW